MTLEDFIKEIELISEYRKNFKPHKLLAILTVLCLIDENIIDKNEINFDENFKNKFKELIENYGGENDRNRPYNPFFHLSSSSFWNLVPIKGKEGELENSKTIGSAKDLEEIVSHAKLNEQVFKLFNNAEARNKIIEKIIEYLSLRFSSSEPSPNLTSLFTHEANAIKNIENRIRANNLGFVSPNIEIHDAQSNQYYEIDVIIISQFGIYVTELKHWSGLIQIQPYSWIQNKSIYKPDPHKTNNLKAKLIKSLFERAFPSFPSVYVESVVVLTNPEATIEGASLSTHDKHSPSFDSIESFVRYLKNQRKINAQKLKTNQCEAFKNYLEKLRSTGPPKDFNFLGYEIVERLYQGPERAEVVAKRTDLRHRKLSRLRIFIPPTAATEPEKRSFLESANATLNAVAKIGDHPNILKVWSIPNENNFIVEGSDWSESGTLRDVLYQIGKFNIDEAKSIFKGILTGLNAIHNEYVIHRDLSPQNILMVNNIPKLMNFDLSYQLEDQRVTVISDVSKLRRTPYIAPEVYQPGNTPEATADLFSAGVLFYEMLVGKPPFKSSTDLDNKGGKLSGETLDVLNKKEVPEHFQNVITNLVLSDPAKRLKSVDQILNILLQDSEELEPQEPNQVLQPGDQYDVYQIQNFIKYGNSSQIYRADGIRGKQIAIKLFNIDYPLDRIVKEQSLAAAVRHPSIVSVGTASRWDNERFFLPFDWIGSRSLKYEIDQKIKPDLPRFQEIALQVLDALMALHNREEEGIVEPIVHNDIKPENILLTDEGDRPVLIDFGSASNPHIGAYEGTEGYVAPDLHMGQDRQYCESGDLYAIGVTLFEWFLGEQPLKNTDDKDFNIEISTSLSHWFEQSTAKESSARFVSAHHMAESLKMAINKALYEDDKIETDEEIEIEEATEEPYHEPFEHVDLDKDITIHPNPFVAYLNSLHSINAGNENATAEAQILNDYFSFIQVSHPITNYIHDQLRQREKCHIILTGHAGDGKTTIAAELCKKVRGIQINQSLPKPISKRENLSDEKISLSIIKDFSECSENEKYDLIDEMLDISGDRFVLISNTGTLLNSFIEYERTKKEGDRIATESKILTAIEDSMPHPIKFNGASFLIINLSMMDHLHLARQIFEKMIDDERWNACESVKCREKCPIYRNVKLIKQNQKIALDRMFLIYRAMYEYGTRFTLRQLTAHFAYLLTSGLTYQDINNMSQKAAPPLMREFMFFNRFFGDNGANLDQPALQLKVIREIRKQGFGQKPCPLWERKLWLQTKEKPFTINAKACGKEFEQLREIGSGVVPLEIDNYQQYMALAREQVRRMLYFLNDFSTTDVESFITTFLNSPMILKFVNWLQTDNNLSAQEKSILHTRIIHVLQEHFTGLRILEGTRMEELYVTLNRHSHEVRQSAQVVLARFSANDFKLKLVLQENIIRQKRKELFLEDLHNRIMSPLKLTLPFLDYVMQRNHGEITDSLNSSYVNRLERFKGQLIEIAKVADDEDVILVQLKTNHAFRRQIFSVSDNRLEVSNA